MFYSEALFQATALALEVVLAGISVIICVSSQSASRAQVALSLSEAVERRTELQTLKDRQVCRYEAFELLPQIDRYVGMKHSSCCHK